MPKTIHGNFLRKIYLLSTLLVGFQYSISVYGETYRQMPKVTITARNIALEVVFKKIEQQTGMTIRNNFQATQLNEKKKVTVNFLRTDINEVMTFLLNDKDNLSFSIKDGVILIFRQVFSFRNLMPNGDRKDTISNSIKVSGKVIDKDGNPIPGASIKIKNSTSGTASNNDGSFRLTTIEKGETIIISSIGFESKEITADNGNLIVQLNSHTNLLDEKIIMAYGNTTKRLNTGNINSIKAIDIENQPVSNPLIALQGKTPGVFIQQSSGLSGSGVTVRIQGVNSISSGNDPFYVVDGVPYVSQLLPTTNVSGGYSGVNGIAGNPLSYINSADIESIEILKDADATAIYGSRAANGAVLITTKKGKMGPVRATFTFQNGWAKVPHKIDLLNRPEYLEMRHEGLKNDDVPISIFDWDLNGTWDSTRDIDWQKELIGNTARYTDAQVNISGGNAFTQFMVGAGFHKETTVFPGSFSDSKGSVHINLNSNSANQKFKIQFTSSFLFDDNRLPISDLTTNAIILAPVAPDPYNPDGSLNWSPDANGSSTYWGNPIASIAQKSRNKTYNLISNSIISYEIVPGLVLKSSFGFNSLNTDEITKTPNSVFPPEFRQFVPNSSEFITNKLSSWIVEPQIEYNRKISKGNINILLGSTLSQNNSDQQRIAAFGFINELVMEDLKSATSTRGSSINSMYKYNALYSRITYNWLNKYLINLTARRDGSSRFGPENQFHNFGAIGAAWIFSEEQFIQSYLPFLSFGKLRGSFGTTGNDQIGEYQFMDIYEPVNISGNAYQGIIGLAPTRITNLYLQWEETKKLQLGLEIGFIKDKILFTANYNQNRSSNQLLQNELTSITGFLSIARNFPAVVQNSGWEFTLNTVNIKTKHFYWATNFNITVPKNQLLSYFGQDKNENIGIGQPLSAVRYYKYAGVNDTTGKYQFIDSKGNYTTSPSDPIDRTVIVNFDPKFYGGIQNSLTYKGLSLDFFFLFTKRSAIDNLTYGNNNLAYYPGVFNSGVSNQVTAVLNRWQKPGDKATVQPFSAGNNVNLNNLKNSDAIYTDGSYIRLKNVSFSWQLPQSWRKTLHFQNAKEIGRAHV